MSEDWKLQYLSFWPEFQEWYGRNFGLRENGPKTPGELDPFGRHLWNAFQAGIEAHEDSMGDCLGEDQ